MNEQVGIGLFEKLALTNWYKYLLYVSGIILILSFFFESPVFEQRKIVEFSLSSIGVLCFVWIIENILRRYFYYCEEKRHEFSPQITEEQKTILIISAFTNVSFFFIWVLIVVVKLLI